MPAGSARRPRDYRGVGWGSPTGIAVESYNSLPLFSLGVATIVLLAQGEVLWGIAVSFGGKDSLELSVDVRCTLAINHGHAASLLSYWGRLPV